MSTIHKLIDSKIIPNNVVKRMNSTLPGVMARFLDDLLYGMLEDGNNYWKVNRRVYVSEANQTDLKRILVMDGQYVDTAKSLRNLMHYLEEMALKEVLSE